MSEGLVMPTLKIDPEFQNKIPPLTDAEFEQLKENILNAGEVWEPIVVWNGTIVDGHNRYRIVSEHPEIKWRIREMTFADKWEAIDWMCKNQLGRRNLTDVQITILRGKMYEARKKSVGAKKGNENAKKQIAQNDPIEFSEIKQNDDKKTESTAEIIAKELHVAPATIKRSEQFAKGYDVIQEKDPELASEILSGKKNVNKGDVIEIARSKEEKQADLIEKLKEDKKTGQSAKKCKSTKS